MLKLKRKITLSILLVAVVSSLTIGLYSWTVYRDSIITASMEQLECYVQDRWFLFNHDLQDAIAGRTLLTNYVENSFSVEQFKQDSTYMNRYKQQLESVVKSVAQANKSLSAYIYFDPEFTHAPDSVWYADMDRNSKVELQPEFTLDYYSPGLPNRQWFYTPLRENRAIWTSPYQGNMDYNKDLTFISHTGPIVVQNRVIAVSGVDYYLDQLIEQVKQLRFEGTQYAVLLDGDLKTLVYPSLDTGMYFPDVSLGKSAEIAATLNNSVSGSIEFLQTDGKSRLLSFRKLENGWIFGCVLFKDDALKKLNDLQRFITGLLLTVLLVSGLLSVYFSKIISSPLEHLTSVVRQIGDGNYRTVIDWDTRSQSDEIGELAQSVEKMRVQLLDDYEKISTHNLILESTVEQRTAELKTVNAALENSLGHLEEEQQRLALVNEELEVSLDSLMKSQNQLVITEKVSALGYMITGIAHELNTPLGNSVTLISYVTAQAEAMTHGLADGTISRQDLTSFLGIVDESGGLIQSNLAKVDQMLQKFKHLAESTTLSDISTFNVLEYIKYSVDRVRGLYAGSPLRVEISCPEDLEFRSDPIKFSQIVSNLLTNSYQHGFSEASEGLVQIRVSLGSGTINLRYQDNGIGIPAENLNDLFTPGFSEKLNRISGLGLNMVYNLVTTGFNGSIECVSGTGQGVDFALVLREHLL